MSFHKADFVPGTLIKVNNKGVRGFGNTITKKTHIGTIKWKVYNDDGLVHDIIKPNSYYVPSGRSRLLSPQQQAQDNHPVQNGTWCATYHDSVVCYWDQQKYKITKPLDPGSTNVGTTNTASGVDQAIAAVDSIWDSTKDYAMDSMVSIPEIMPELYPLGTDDHGIPIETVDSRALHTSPVDEEDNEQQHQITPDPEGDREHSKEQSKKVRPLQLLVLPTETDIRPINSPRNNSDENEMKNRRLLQWWHEKLGHISMHTIQNMASKGMLPAGIAPMQSTGDDQTSMEDQSYTKTNQHCHHGTRGLRLSGSTRIQNPRSIGTAKGNSYKGTIQSGHSIRGSQPSVITHSSICSKLRMHPKP
jgi:hypothetical protein